MEESENWKTLEQAIKTAEREGVGVGFVFTEDDPYVGIDFDDCIEDGKVKEEVSKYIEEAFSYTEISPSGNGIHIIGKGKLEGTLKREDIGIEMYQEGRFFTITGRVKRGTKIIKPIQHVIDDIFEKYGEEVEKKDEIDYEPRGNRGKYLHSRRGSNREFGGEGRPASRPSSITWLRPNRYELHGKSRKEHLVLPSPTRTLLWRRPFRICRDGGRDNRVRGVG